MAIASKSSISKLLTYGLAASTLIGCSDTAGLDEGDFLIQSEGMAYARGEVIRVTVVNKSSATFFVNPCFLDLQVREGASWRTISASGCIDYDLSLLRELDPDEEHQDSSVTALTDPAGDYRLLFDLRSKRKPSTVEPAMRNPIAVSNTFRIQ